MAEKETYSFEDKEKMRMTFEQLKTYAERAGEALKLVDLENSQSKGYTVYDKTQLRRALQNPLTESNSKTLRQLS